VIPAQCLHAQVRDLGEVANRQPSSHDNSLDLPSGGESTAVEPVPEWRKALDSPPGGASTMEIHP
jgi:hypothetical protein